MTATMRRWALEDYGRRSLRLRSEPIPSAGPGEVLVKVGAVSLTSLDDAEASTLPVAGLTAWFALVERGALRVDQTVLVHGTGGVALFGVQIARMHGVTAIVTSGSDEKLARANPAVVAPIIGARTLAQADDNLGALDVTLTADHKARLDSASAPVPIFPGVFLARPMIRQLMHGGATVVVR